RRDPPALHQRLQCVCDRGRSCLAGFAAGPAADRRDVPLRGHPRPGEPRQGDGPGDDGRRRRRHDALRVAGPPREPVDEAMTGRRAVMRRNQRLFRWIVLTVVLIFFGLPMLAMLEFTTRGADGGRSAATWSALADVGE